MQSDDLTCDSKVLVRNPLLRVSSFDGAGKNKQVLCEIPAVHGRDYRFLVAEEALRKLDAFDGQRDVASAINFAYPHDEVSQGIFRRFIIEHCLPAAILVSDGSGEVGLSSRRNRNYMAFQVPLLSARAVALVSRCFLWCYSTPVVLMAAAVIFAGQLLMLKAVHLAGGRAEQFGLADIFLALCILTAGLFLHEFGHAAAARRYGCSKVTIGVGWYICFVVFYADLSETWRLSRLQRCVVDSGGMYFQATFVALLALVDFVAPSAAVHYAAVVLNVSLLWNLNPFFRMDGYWLASDMLGVANLRSEAGLVLKELAAKWTGGSPQICASVQSNLTRRTRSWLVGYSIASVVFLCYFVHMLIFATLPDLLVSVFSKLPSVIGFDVSDDGSVFLDGVSTLWKLFVLGCIVFVVSRLLYRALRAVASLRFW